jgi:hypothetical protein
MSHCHTFCISVLSVPHRKISKFFGFSSSHTIPSTSPKAEDSFNSKGKPDSWKMTISCFGFIQSVFFRSQFIFLL